MLSPNLSAAPVAAGLKNSHLSRTTITSFETVHYRNEPDFDAGEFDPSVYVFGVDVNCDGSAFAASLSNNAINVYSTDTGALVTSLTGHRKPITDMKYSRHAPSTVYSSGEDRRVCTWDARAAASKAPVASFDCRGEAYCVSAGCGDTVIAVGVEAAVEFFDTRTRARIGVYADNHTDEVTQVAFHPLDETQVVSGSEDGLVCVYDTKCSNADQALQGILNTNCAIRRLGFFGAGYEGLFCISGSETLSLWHTKSFQCIRDWQNAREVVGGGAAPMMAEYLVDCHYEPEGDELYLLSGDWGGNVVLSTVTDQVIQPVKRLSTATPGGGHCGGVRCGRMRGSIVLTGGEDSRVCQWDLNKPERASASSNDQGRVGERGRRPAASGPARTGRQYSGLAGW